MARVKTLLAETLAKCCSHSHIHPFSLSNSTCLCDAVQVHGPSQRGVCLEADTSLKTFAHR